MQGRKKDQLLVKSDPGESSVTLHLQSVAQKTFFLFYTG